MTNTQTLLLQKIAAASGFDADLPVDVKEPAKAVGISSQNVMREVIALLQAGMCDQFMSDMTVVITQQGILYCQSTCKED